MITFLLTFPVNFIGVDNINEVVFGISVLHCRMLQW